MLMALIVAIEEGNGPDRAETERLLLKTATGDAQAFELLYRRTRAAVYALALSIMKDAHEAEDVTQDTFVAVWEKAPTYRAQGSPMAWMLTIGRNLCLMRLRRSQRHVTLEDHQWQAIPVEDTALSAEDRFILQAALSKLEDTERQVVLLHAVSGLKHREIAQVLELSLSATLSKYHRALKKLRNFVKGDEPRDQ